MNSLAMRRSSAAAAGPRSTSRRAVRVKASAVKAGPSEETVGTWIAADRLARQKHLEAQASSVLTLTAREFQSPVFPCALIAGDVAILHLLHKLDLLKSGKVKVAFIDTFHLFDETHTFLKQLEDAYQFKAHVFHAAGFANKEEYKKAHGSDLFLTDIEKYDRICKVEPFQRALKDLKADAMVNGRRRDHGAERAHLDVFEFKNALTNVQPLAWWEFQDCFAYLERHGVPKHPLHDQGYPSVGDAHSTVPVPREKWFEYGGERSGRFQGLTNPDGSAKTECGIHNRK